MHENLIIDTCSDRLLTTRKNMALYQSNRVVNLTTIYQKKWFQAESIDYRNSVVFEMQAVAKGLVQNNLAENELFATRTKN